MGDSPRKRFDGFLALDMAMYLHIYNIYIHTIYVYNIYICLYIYTLNNIYMLCTCGFYVALFWGIQKGSENHRTFRITLTW